MIPDRSSLNRYEIACVLLIVLVSIAHATHNILTLGYIGQDYQQHTTVLETTFNSGMSFASSSPPALYLLGSAVRKIAPTPWRMEYISFALVLINIFALLIWYQMLRVLIPATLVRLAAFLILVFLPVRTIHSAVFAADSLTLVPLLVAVIMIVAHTHARSWISQLLCALGVGVACCLGLFIKYTFVLLPAGCALLYLFWALRPGSTRWKIVFLTTGLLGAILPSVFFGLWVWDQMKASKNVWINNAQEGKGMEWRDVFLPKPKDIEIFRAPDFVCGQPMTASDGHSYPALLHLGTFSDVWNFFQDPSEEMLRQRTLIGISFGRDRHPLSKSLSPLCLILSIPITLLALVGSLIQMGRATWATLSHPTPRSDLICALGILSAAYAAPSVGGLPYYWAVYIYGFWTPRLVFPSLLAAITIGFSTIGGLQTKRWFRLGILAYTLTLSALYLLTL